jgi:hypothetical protein
MGKLVGVVTLFVLSCGGKQAPKPQPTDETKKQYAPLTIKQDAKRPNQAVILGTDEGNGSTVVPLPVTPMNGVVDAMFVRTGAGVTASGGSSPVKLGTAPNQEQTVQVGIYEEMAGGAGPQWRAGVWVSAFVAANTLGKDLTDFTFTASSGGFIDGASASGLMAGGFLSTMTGAKIDGTATMTGIINPDGTIGPVDGIPEKFSASIAKGKKRLGYPIGMRYAESAASGEKVDLEQLAKDGGATAVEIANVHDAYKLLTGRALPQPVPVTEADMALDAETTKAISVKYKAWQQRLAGEWSQLLQLQQAGRLPTRLALMASHAQKTGEEAERLHAQGKVAAAYARVLSAWVSAASATDTYDILTKVAAGDTVGAMGALGALDALDAATTEVFKKIGAMKPNTMGGHLQMMGAFQSALRGWGFKMFAADSVTRTRRFMLGLDGRSREELASPELANEVVENVAPTVLLIGRTVAETIHAAQRIEFESEKTINYMCSLPNVRRLATSYASASAAGINYFETLIVQDAARAQNLTFEEASRQFALKEPEYLIAFQLSRLANNEGLPKQLREQWGEKSLAWNLMALAGNELAYSVSGELIAKHHSIGVKVDPTGRVDSVVHEKAFANMLETAEKTARASARAARIATGAIPVQSKIAYQIASIQRDGDTADKIEALAGYWTASALSQTAVALARN